ncbi:MAG: efflux transporter outer membrane subunit [Desulfuromonadales bacterium]|nr:efflux transporter outer membrane subunit [Desulfuromonadales bacterium]MBN2792849.1 efflux transporter outer membrane subunit [Desulfuromonadales bacterium]
MQKQPAKRLRPLYLILLGLLSVTVGLGGCTAVGPDYTQPEPEITGHWHTELPSGLTADSRGSVQTDNWWRVFNDPQLEALLRRSVQGNLDLKKAKARIQEARAVRGIAEADFFPSLDGVATATRSRSSANSSTGTERSLFAVGFDSAWELDIFGGVQRSLEAAQAELDAIEADAHSLVVSLAAEVALNYVEYRTNQTRLALSQGNISALTQSYELNRSRYRAGLISELPVQESLRLLESSKALVPTLESALGATKNRLAILLGEQPGQLHQELADIKALPRLPASVAVGIPAETLRHRPDIRSAERRLAAQSARVGVATADLYPRFRLTGSLGLEALNAGELFETASRRWSFGPGIQWKIFSAGAVRRHIDVQNARQEQALIQYEQSILSALEEVENALVAYGKEQQRRAALAGAVSVGERTSVLAQDQYQAGLVNFTTVLDAQRSLLALQDELVRSDGNALAQLIRLYKALGGGWQSALSADDQPTRQ